DPGPRYDPLVRGIDHLLEIVVGQHLARGVAAPTGHVGVADGRAHSGSTSMSGCLALTRAPFSGTTRTTRPARSDLISLNSFIASIRPITWPTATSRPAATNGADPGAGEPYQTPVSGALTVGREGVASPGPDAAGVSDPGPEPEPASSAGPPAKATTTGAIAGLRRTRRVEP